jgi:hypothetical protein
MLGKLICWLTGKHVWKRNNRNMMRSCRRCGIIVPIKRRVAK